LENLHRSIDAANRLIESAAKAVTSFYRDDARRFLRDTRDEPGTPRFSTGGAAVAADLWEIAGDLPYLKAVLGKGWFEALETSRGETSAWVADPSNGLKFKRTFGKLNPYSISVAAHQVVEAGAAGPRALALSSVVLNEYARGWPEMHGVDHPHPYVAHRVFRVSEALIGYGVDSAVMGADRRKTVKAADLPYSDAINKAWRGLGRSFDRAGARRAYAEATTTYLWQQHGFAAPESFSAPNWLRYDPVGTCFALCMLIEASKLEWEEDDSTRHLTEYEDLVQLSVHHVLAAMTPTGSLPYGLPFSYIESGLGAFATSISGLAALVRVLHSLFEDSRRSFYKNASFIETLMDTNADGFERLFALPTKIEGAKRRVAHLLDPSMVCTGWSTDRAASLTRIESWVSMDVLIFAVYLRLLVQEVAQFRVVRKYGAVPVPRETPRWPLGGRGTGGPLMQDPDALDPGVSAAAKAEHEQLAPVPVLNNAFGKFMSPDCVEWESTKSAFLLFGPPGTSKSTLAQSLAKALDWHFLELTPSNFVDQGLEMIERRSREIFEELGVLRETVVLFDELDSLLADREQLDASSILNFTVPAMLPKLQTLTKVAKNQRLIVIFATNFYDRLDAAMSRRGRIDERLVVLPYSRIARRVLLDEKLKGKALDAGVDATALGVFEDIKRYRTEVADTGKATEPVAGITPALYSSRIPSAADRGRAMRATERLAVEVAEVVGRLGDEPRKLGADAAPDDIKKRLRALAGGLDKQEWRDLCDRLLEALKPAT
jgi:hypothetical protein